MQLNIRDTSKDDPSAILDIYNDEILNGTATFHTIPQTIAERVQWLANTQGKQYVSMHGGGIHGRDDGRKSHRSVLQPLALQGAARI